MASVASRRRLAAVRAAVGPAAPISPPLAAEHSAALASTAVPAPPTPGAAEPLTPAEAHFFKHHGYLIKRNLLPKASLDPVLDYVWARAPDCVRRDDPATFTDAHRLWQRTPVNGEVGGDRNHGSGARGDNGVWQLLSSGPQGLGTEPFVLDATARSDAVQSVVAALIGTPLRRTTRTRGVYAVFPTPPPHTAPFPHWDSCGHQVGAMVLLDDCAAGGGCLHLWPGSHHLLFPLFTTAQGNIPADSEADTTASTPTVRQALAEINASIQPVEFDGQGGDVCFLHHRMA